MCNCGGGGAGSIGVGGTGSVRSDVWVHILPHDERLGEAGASKVFYPSEQAAKRAAESHGGTYKKFVHA